MAEHVYEGMFLLDSGRYARDAAGVSGQVTQLIDNSGGELLASRLWNEQKVAYPINGQRKGTYWLTYFRMDSASLTKLNRDTQLSEVVLRSLILKVEPRLVDAMVAHAKGTASSEEPDAVEQQAPESTAAGTVAETTEAKTSDTESSTP